MIGIAQVLDKIDLSPIEGTFSITFVKEDGTLRTIEKAQKGHKSGGAKSETNNFRYKIKERGVVIVCDTEAQNERNRFRTIKISRILTFNGVKVLH